MSFKIEQKSVLNNNNNVQSIDKALSQQEICDKISNINAEQILLIGFRIGLTIWENLGSSKKFFIEKKAQTERGCSGDPKVQIQLKTFKLY